MYDTAFQSLPMGVLLHAFNGVVKCNLHCVQKKTPTHIFFHISMSDV